MQLYPCYYHVCVSSLFSSVCDFTLCIILFLPRYKLMIVSFNYSFFILMDLSILYQITEIIFLWFSLRSIFFVSFNLFFPSFHMHCAYTGSFSDSYWYFDENRSFLISLSGVHVREELEQNRKDE